MQPSSTADVACWWTSLSIKPLARDLAVPDLSLSCQDAQATTASRRDDVMKLGAPRHFDSRLLLSLWVRRHVSSDCGASPVSVAWSNPMEPPRRTAFAADNVSDVWLQRKRHSRDNLPDRVVCPELGGEHGQGRSQCGQKYLDARAFGQSIPTPRTTKMWQVRAVA